MSEPATKDDTRDATTPFKALIAGWSLIVVVLSVAGYSYRWNYYYNFGLHSLVLAAPLESLPVYAIEIARNRAFVMDLLRLALIYLVPFRLGLLLLGQARAAGNARISAAARLVTRVFALDSPLLTDTVTAGLLLLIAFRAGGDAGYRTYLVNVVEGTSRLPRITAIGSQSSEPVLPIACDPRMFKDEAPVVRYLGDPGIVRSLTAGGTCSSDESSWRLLLRDESFIYLFATVQDQAERPQTLILPNDDQLTLVLR